MAMSKSRNWPGGGRDELPGPVLASFRPTRRQLVGHWLYLGLLASAGLLAVAAVPVIVGLLGAGPRPDPLLPAWALWGLSPVPLGLLVGLAAPGGAGAVVDDRGVRRVPSSSGAVGAWTAIVDIRAERRAGRTAVALYLDTGAVVRLRAPYDGRLLGHDPDFERKVFTLRNLWENHRRWR